MVSCVWSTRRPLQHMFSLVRYNYQKLSSRSHCSTEDSLSIRPSHGGGGRGRREREEKGFSSSPLSLFRFHLSPFPPETPDTQATQRKLQLLKRNQTLYYLALNIVDILAKKSVSFTISLKLKVDFHRYKQYDKSFLRANSEQILA